MFNLVFTCNVPSVRLWQRLGFQQIGLLPNAGNMKGVGMSDAIIFYKAFEEDAQT
ncbi:hypothetical protein PTSG_11932 [Salpingoeca rosetta]|uniref:N-acetyltransferase domain-containing protein n=1 Tax=Salpingoeca rosetta (strain ATCC 50818 / BSB-021) TaxID=946362 RepID=F2U3I4_SALR5|nr:uncharacterized protein PTSG_11932 [Salpingoeca rosetta]EGD82178.1 hypothetical protein PTSG_11932 [Salpingoeca rosetta]|eukprot:XP_004996361.1 hypothetical protein PTSG_11932 [Salpingoeca rosetta]